MRFRNPGLLVLTLFFAAACSSGVTRTSPQKATAQKKNTPIKRSMANEDGDGASGVEVVRTECTKGDVTRTILLENKKVPTQPGAPICFVKYKRGKILKVVARASFNRSHCQKVSKNLSDNLSNAGYSCETQTE